MLNINVKQEIIELCDAQINLWELLKEKINSISDNDKAELVLTWKNFFNDHTEAVQKLSDVREYTNEITKELIMTGELHLEEGIIE